MRLEGPALQAALPPLGIEEERAVARATEELRERGYTVFERAYDDSEVRYLRGLLLDAYDRVGRPPLRANPPVRPAENVEVGPAGIIFHKLTRLFPEVGPHLLKRPIVETMRRLMGPGMYLELPAGVLSDASRPFFDWHTHIDGVDDAFYGNRRPYPSFTTSERVTHLLYLDDIDERRGRLLVLPRKIGEPTAPPQDPRAERWEGMVAIECPAGSVVVLEQCTWHAAERMTVPGLRSFVGCYFSSGRGRPTPLADPELAHWSGSDALFRSVLPPASAFADANGPCEGGT
jgi:hypothetical protein